MKLEVGKYYKNRDGEVVKIVKYSWDSDYLYYDGSDTYLESGQYCKSLPGSVFNLIEEVMPVPAYKVKAEQTDRRDFIRQMEGEKGKVYTKFRLLKQSAKFIAMGFWTYHATQVDAGYIDPITGDFVMNESKGKKLKLEVGKTYRDGYGEIHTIVSNKINLCYPDHTFRSDEERSYTVEGFWQMEKKDHKYNLIEEVVETKTTTTKKEQLKMKYYRTTEKNTEANKDFPVGTIVTLYYDDGTPQPHYKDVNSDRTQYLFTDRLEEVNVKTVKTVISPVSKLVKILEDSGDKVNEDGHWRGAGQTFASDMFFFCGKEPGSPWVWEPEWLEEKVVFDSVVNTFNARQFIVDFMKKKRELSHEAYLYQRDIDEIENEWSDEECEKVASRILAQVEIDFSSSCCPFCIKFPRDCDNCSYGKRHGVCSNDSSDFHKYIKPGAYTKSWPELLEFINNYPGARK